LRGTVFCAEAIPNRRFGDRFATIAPNDGGDCFAKTARNDTGLNGYARSMGIVRSPSGPASNADLTIRSEQREVCEWSRTKLIW